MQLKIEDGSKYYVLNQRYHRLFLQSCTIMAITCIVCYTYLRIDKYSSHSYGNFTRRNFREVIGNILRFNRSVPATPISRERKLVLLWTPYFAEKDWLPSTHHLDCPIQECDVTSNRSLLLNSSAVLFHWRDINPDDLPNFLTSYEYSKTGTPLVVLFNKEAPPNTNANSLTTLNEKIHLTATYRRDSNIYAPYGRIEKRTKPFKMPGV
ncbi:alpha-(1,3)-fucosyltransferase C [Trichonephila clavipes]|nr:alpha-(1,3)-fucosyltransferase C [Trichonephila clavipes]